MKYVREHINEKFVQNSDPIKDMGIGYSEEINFTKESDNLQYEVRNEIAKIKTKKTKYFKKKLIGKKITGEFRIWDKRGRYIKSQNKTILVKKIVVHYYFDGSIEEIALFSKWGTKHTIRNSYTYKITN